MLFVAPVVLLPINRTGLPIIPGKRFQINNIDDPIVIQISGGGRGSIVVHANGHGVELVYDVVVVNIASQKIDRRKCGCVTSRNRDRA